MEAARLTRTWAWPGRPFAPTAKAATGLLPVGASLDLSTIMTRPEGLADFS